MRLSRAWVPNANGAPVALALASRRRDLPAWTKPVLPVKLLEKCLVLYRDEQGELGTDRGCLRYRRVNLVSGVQEADGLRCPYHGWLYDSSGQCIEMPAEPGDSTFPSR